MPVKNSLEKNTLERLNNAEVIPNVSQHDFLAKSPPVFASGFFRFQTLFPSVPQSDKDHGSSSNEDHGQWPPEQIRGDPRFHDRWPRQQEIDGKSRHAFRRGRKQSYLHIYHDSAECEPASTIRLQSGNFSNQARIPCPAATKTSFSALYNKTAIG